MRKRARKIWLPRKARYGQQFKAVFAFSREGLGVVAGGPREFSLSLGEMLGEIPLGRPLSFPLQLDATCRGHRGEDPNHER